ncbi:MAG: hypothetical protein AB4038_03325 [Prochloraceae cyanobacterium]
MTLANLPLEDKKYIILLSQMQRHLVDEIAKVRDQPTELVLSAFSEIAKADLALMTEDEINFIIETNDKIRGRK